MLIITRPRSQDCVDSFKFSDIDIVEYVADVHNQKYARLSVRNQSNQKEPAHRHCKEFSRSIAC